MRNINILEAIVILLGIAGGLAVLAGIVLGVLALLRASRAKKVQKDKQVL